MNKIKIPSKEEKIIEALKVESDKQKAVNDELSNYMLDVDMRLVKMELGIQ